MGLSVHPSASLVLFFLANKKNTCYFPSHQGSQLRVGHVLLDVDGRSLRGLEHKEACRLIAESFKNKRRDTMEFHVMETPAEGRTGSQRQGRRDSMERR